MRRIRGWGWARSRARKFSLTNTASIAHTADTQSQTRYPLSPAGARCSRFMSPGGAGSSARHQVLPGAPVGQSTAAAAGAQRGTRSSCCHRPREVKGHGSPVSLDELDSGCVSFFVNLPDLQPWQQGAHSLCSSQWLCIFALVSIMYICSGFHYV